MNAQLLTTINLTQAETDLLMSILEATQNFITPEEDGFRTSYIISTEEVDFARKLNNILTKELS